MSQIETDLLQMEHTTSSTIYNNNNHYYDMDPDLQRYLTLLLNTFSPPMQQIIKNGQSNIDRRTQQMIEFQKTLRRY